MAKFRSGDLDLKTGQKIYFDDANDIFMEYDGNELSISSTVSGVRAIERHHYVILDQLTQASGSLRNYIDAGLESQNEFIELTDTPATYSGNAGNYVVVSSTESGVEFVSADVVEDKWFSQYIHDTPSKIVSIFGNGANSFNPGHDIRILAMKILYYSEHANLSDLRVRVYKYDMAAATDRLVLSAQASSIPIGFHELSDSTPDTNYYDLNSSAGDGIWLLLDESSGSDHVKKVSEITINIKYKII